MYCSTCKYNKRHVEELPCRECCVVAEDSTYWEDAGKISAKAEAEHDGNNEEEYPCKGCVYFDGTGCQQRDCFLPAPTAEAESSGTEAPANLKKFDTGAIRSSDADHARYDLIPRAAMESLAVTLKEGAEKYGEYNWQKGFPKHDVINHCLQHIYKYLDGDRSEDHIGHALCNLAFLSHFIHVETLEKPTEE